MNLRAALDEHGGLISAKGIAQEHGVTGEAVRQWAAREGFPEAIEVQGGWRVWVVSEVNEWASSNRPTS